MKEGKDHGSGASWYRSGQKQCESIYKDGKLLTEIGWQPNGERCPFTNVLNGSGTLVLWHENGQKRSEESFKDGDECGLKIFWNEDSLKTAERNYDYGNEGECLETRFTENGKKWVEGVRKNDIDLGIWINSTKMGIK